MVCKSSCDWKMEVKINELHEEINKFAKQCLEEEKKQYIDYLQKESEVSENVIHENELGE